MECLVCRQKIKPGEQIFWVTPVVFCGPEDGDVDHVDASDDFTPAVHRICMESPTEAAKTPDTATPEPAEEESVVQRSDALALLNL